MEKKKKKIHCGECCWFYGEDTDGFGMCPYLFGDSRNCSYKCMRPSDAVSKMEMWHHMEVLIKFNRYRRDNHVPSIYEMPDTKEIGEAIDFAIKYMKVFCDL